MFVNLTHENFLLFAAKSYTSPHYVEQEFFSDLKRIKYIKRLLQKYRISGDLKERLILNHIILIYNVFEAESCTKMLFLKINSHDYSALKTFLIFLNYMPNIIESINGNIIYSSDINIDFKVANALRQL
jgi:hypothetical protein